MRYFGIFVFLFTIMSIIVLLFWKNYISKSLVLLGVGIEYVKQNKTLVFMPLLLFIIWMIVFICEIVAFIFIYAINSSSE